MDQQVWNAFSYGLFVVTAASGGRESGCILNTAGQVTTSPAQISITINRQNFTHELLMNSGRFNLSIISEQATFDLFRHFGFQSGRTVDKFADGRFCKRSANGLYYVTEGANAYVSASVEQTVDLGSHTLVIASVTDLQTLTDVPSATYAYYHASIKPKADQKPTESNTAWRCRICGYVYEGEELPEDYICPLCKHPASDFERVDG